MQYTVYKQTCRKCKEEKPEAEMVRYRGKAINLCLKCANAKNKYQKTLQKSEIHPWRKDYHKITAMKYNFPLDFLDKIEKE